MDPRLRRIADYLSKHRERHDIDPLLIAPDLLPYFYILEVREGSSSDLPRLYIRLVGTALDSAFGRCVKGHYLEEFLHGSRSTDVLDGFRACAATKRPLWMRQVVQIADKVPRFVEGVAFPINPDLLYGGLAVGEISAGATTIGFESHDL